MKYIYSNANNIDTLEIETEGNRVSSVVTLVPPKNGADEVTAEDLQRSLALYMRRPNATIEQALSAYAGGYNAVRRVED